MTHDAGIAIAYVIAEGRRAPGHVTAPAAPRGPRSTSARSPRTSGPARRRRHRPGHGRGQGERLRPRRRARRPRRTRGRRGLARRRRHRRGARAARGRHRAPILAWLHGPDADFDARSAAGIEIGVTSLEQLRRVAAAAAAPSRPRAPQARHRAQPQRRARAGSRLFARCGAVRATRRRAGRGLFSHLSNTGAEVDAAQLAVFEHAVAVAGRPGCGRNCGTSPRPRRRCPAPRRGTTWCASGSASTGSPVRR